MPARPTLPQPLTAFFGRDEERRAIVESLGNHRLVTLIGPGGVGKTRLAIEAAREMEDRFPERVWFVDLSPVSDGEAIPAAVRAGLGVDEAKGGAEGLVDVIADREMLLVLDNCEHIVKPVALLVDRLVQDCSKLRLLCTSREPLGVQGESLRRVAPLSVPSGDSPAVSEMVRWPAVQLFVDRARLAVSEFELTEGNAATVLHILRAVDGLPLATELVTARLRTLGLDQLAARLGERLPMLAGGGRTAPARQRTIEATVAWSHDLLTESEKLLFRRLAAFTGGWTLEAAEEVCAFTALDEAEVFPLLEALVDRSLVVALPGEGRFRFLEVILEFARNELLASAEVAEIGSRHLSWFARLASRADADVLGPANAFWRDRLKAEHENVLAALEWATTHPADVGKGLQLLGSVHWYWQQWVNNDEALLWSRRLLEVDEGASPAWRIRVLIGAAWYGGGDADASARYAQEALLLAHEMDDDRLRGRAFDAVARAAMTRLDVEELRRAAEQAAGLAAATGDWASQVRAEVHIAMADEEVGALEAGSEHSRRALALAERAESAPLQALALINLGENARLQGDLLGAEAFYRKALEAARDAEHERLGLLAALNLGATLVMRGKYQPGRDVLLEVLEPALRLGERLVAAEALCGVAAAEAADWDPSLAARLLGAAAAQRADQSQAPDQAVYELALELSRRKLGARFDAEYDEGRRWSLQAAAREVLATGAASPLPPEPVVPAGLTPREVEILRLVAQGKTNRDIAEELVLSRRTVENHIANAYAKIGAGNRAEATRFALEHGLLEISVRH